MSIPRFSFTIEPLSSHHNKSAFCCGVEALDLYLQAKAKQDVRRFLTSVFVLQDLEREQIAGYYTLASTAIQLGELPDSLIRKLPKYPLIPAILLGRLAVSQDYRGQGLGTFILSDALQKSKNSEVASMAVVVDAKDEKAKAFYEYHQFIPFPTQPLRLYLPMGSIVKMFS